MSMQQLLVASIIFIGIFLIAVIAQISVKSFHPFLYWTVIVATTTAGTTIADFAIDPGYWLSRRSFICSFCWLPIASHLVLVRNSISVKPSPPKGRNVHKRTDHYVFSNAGNGPGRLDGRYEWPRLRRALVVRGLALIAVAYYCTKISRTVLFWSAFILTRPLGATMGDFLDKPIAHGGLELSRYTASAALALLMVAFVFFLPQKAGRHS